MLAGLSRCAMCSVPPGFCACAGPSEKTATTAIATATSVHPRRFIPGPPKSAEQRPRLPVEPDVFHAPAVEAAVGHRHQPLELRLHAGCEARIEENRARGILGQPALDLPDHLAPLLRVCFHRLLVDQLLGLPVAVAV